jgi:hypothetical protein
VELILVMDTGMQGIDQMVEAQVENGYHFQSIHVTRSVQSLDLARDGIDVEINVIIIVTGLDNILQVDHNNVMEIHA